MKTFLKTLAFLAIFFATEAKTNFRNTWVFMVGVLEWQDKASFASFDKRGRVDAKIHKFFTENGVPDNRILYIKDQQATTAFVKKQLNEMLDKTKPGDQFFFYYCGHGYKNNAEAVCLANYSGADWTAKEIVATIGKKFKGEMAFVTADCCNSGGLADEAKKYKNIVALTSVVPKDLSTGNWTFSNALLYGLTGQSFVDTNADKKLTIKELADYIDQEMAVVEEQKAAFYIPVSFKNWVITTDIKARTSPREGQHVLVTFDGEDYLGFITKKNANATFTVRYYSYTNNETEQVDAADLKTFTCQADFKIGASVRVYSVLDQKWLPAVVVKKMACLHYISYKGWGAEWNEWVSTENIKK